MFTIFAAILLIQVSLATKISENANACVDGCATKFDTQFKINLTNGNFEAKDLHLVQIYSDNVDDDKEEKIKEEQCSKNVLLRIPFYELNEKTIVKIELNNGDVLRDSLFQIGVNEKSFVQVNNTNLKLSGSKCDEKPVIIKKLENTIRPNSNITIFIANKWIRVDNSAKNSSEFITNEDIFNFFPHFVNKTCEIDGQTNTYSSPDYLYIALNRFFNDSSFSGVGVCSAQISFLNCDNNDEPEMNVNVDGLEYKGSENSISWVHKLDYLEPSLDHVPCSAEGVLKLTFDPEGSRKIARFDLTFGDNINGFTFNIGDSPTNNAYGGDSGTTSNSAEVHSNDNRFYVWLNPKYCGDTLLHRIEYGIFKPNDTITVFVSDQRLEITNNRDYHEIIKNPYLFNLNRQNVTCNCFDTRCYPGVSIDDDLYFSINRVIGGTYRPGFGLCKAKINWLNCKQRVRQQFLNANPKMMSGSIIGESTTPIVATSTTSVLDKTETTTYTTQETTSFLSISETSLELTTTTNTVTETLVNVTDEVKMEGKENITTSLPLSTTESSLIRAENSTLGNTHQNNDTISRAIYDLCKNRSSKDTEMYFEYPYDDTKFIYCNRLSQLSVLPCPMKMKWSQYYQQCLLIPTEESSSTKSATRISSKQNE